MSEIRNTTENKDIDLADKVKKANREIYNQKEPEEYNQNESIFNKARLEATTKMLTDIADGSGKHRLLDIGTGTGNLLRIAQDIFVNCYGMDIGDELLLKIKDVFPKCHLLAGDADNLPFREGVLDCVTCYAMLHHLYAHEKLFKETFRVLKEGGMLYTDHDPNYFFNRFYHLFYMLKHKGRPGFGSDAEELAEYHNAYTSGINPEKIRTSLLEIGFREVKVIYRITDREKWSKIEMMIVALMRMTKMILPLKTFNTHFAIIAKK